MAPKAAPYTLILKVRTQHIDHLRSCARASLPPSPVCGHCEEQSAQGRITWARRGRTRPESGSGKGWADLSPHSGSKYYRGKALREHVLAACGKVDASPLEVAEAVLAALTTEEMEAAGALMREKREKD